MYIIPLFFYLWHPLVMGFILMTGAGAGATLALAVVILFGASRLTAYVPAMRTLVGSAPVRSVRPPMVAMQPLAADA
ncbi:MAG: hypothetical protein PSY12_02900 [bacterium]|nr:hypothetical protein [bacterium]